MMVAGPIWIFFCGLLVLKSRTCDVSPLSLTVAGLSGSVGCLDWRRLLTFAYLLARFFELYSVCFDTLLDMVSSTVSLLLLSLV